METKLLSKRTRFREPSLTPSDPQVLDAPPVETASLVAIRLLRKNPAVRGTTHGE